ncbi:hypothetical protein HYFRA_00006103 [Hymenoscyphus fraxineus]|uniref:Heterokaryon incompatibility domain-containing protein n=1 Tax=Hymenoscyphus fraxineus TaxID=746836 RepID=A0A9N9L9J1_9HELO|nr:hypothetical protein HYFRA_00006103 [Hymenoscyphus fraxineus]
MEHSNSEELDLHHELYQYEPLHTHTSFRVLELLPGEDDDPIRCTLRNVDWVDNPKYEALSYTWGDPKARSHVIVNGKVLSVTVNLCIALKHLRYEDRSRALWADAICIEQSNIPERGYQVRQMRKIFQEATAVIVWIGPDSEDHQAKLAIDSIITISNFLCQKLEIPVSDLGLVDNLYMEIMAKAHDTLPVPNECDFSADAMWKSLVWFYSHPYFTRIWTIQEVNANKERLLQCGLEKVIWDRVSLVACYITMETAFSQAYGFTKAHCWSAATMTTDLVQPKNWLFMLYLASNYSSLDLRDVVYGLRGMMEIQDGAELLEPDYSKSVVEVYRDTVEAAFMNFKRTDALLYVKGTEDPSWIPRWDIPMLFRNPFRFGKPLPWKPAGETMPIYTIDKEANILSLSGSIIGTIEFVEPYNESYFGNPMIDSEEGRETLKGVWQRILKTIGKSHSKLPLSVHDTTAAATSFAFGLNEKSDPAENDILVKRFVAYLKLFLDENTYTAYIPAELSEKSNESDARLFGKPVWDFEYPESTFLITENKFLGCTIGLARPGDIVFVPQGSTYPLVLRPDGKEFRIRGFAYVHGLMHGEERGGSVRALKIR